MDSDQRQLDTEVAALFVNLFDFSTVFQLTWTRYGFSSLVPTGLC